MFITLQRIYFDPVRNRVKNSIKYHTLGARRTLTLTTCFPNKFTCDDGSCVAINKRCNLAVDCRLTKEEYIKE